MTLVEYSKLPELILDGCGHGHRYYGVREQADPELIEELETLLRGFINGFTKFCSFTSDGRLRYLYNYGHGGRGIPFEGVGYQPVTELLKWKEEAEWLEHEMES